MAELWALKDVLKELLAMETESKNLGEGKLLGLRPQVHWANSLGFSKKEEEDLLCKRRHAFYLSYIANQSPRQIQMNI